MENKIEIFSNAEFGAVRMLETTDGKVLFCGADVAKALGYSNSRKALADHCKERGVTKCDTPTNGGVQELTYIDEGNLYRLITHSRLPEAERFESWVFDEVLPTLQKTGSYNISTVGDKELYIRELEAKNREQELKLRQAELLFTMSSVNTISENYRNVLIAKSAEILTGEPVLALPKSEQKTYSAGDIGNMFSVSAQKIGRISNQYDMKTSEYGEWYHDKSKYSSKEIDTFRYNDKAVEKFREILEQ